MILKGSQRSGGQKLAVHLLNTQDNEHIEVYEISGLIADNVQDAFKEMQSLSKGTKCQQYMFSVSLSPPQKEIVPLEYFAKAIADIEDKCGLAGQPRVIVFHEKEGRRHAHCVWSRIDTAEMKAINLPHYKRKLNDVSKQLYLQYGWDLPKGFINQQYRDPMSFNLAQWQQAKRVQEDPRLLKQFFKQAWESSDDRQSFVQALKEHGFVLAKGDRRGFVALDYKGEVYSLSRWIDVKSKDLQSRLGKPENLPSVDLAKADISQKMTDRLKNHIESVQAKTNKAYEPIKRATLSMRDRHRSAREKLYITQKERWQQEEKERTKRLPHGLKGIWQRVTGQYQKIRKQNESETQICTLRDRDEKQALITAQLQERQRLQEQILHLRHQRNKTLIELRQDIGHYQHMQGRRIENQEFQAISQQREQRYDLTL
jgi:hypothetical protein